MCWPPSMPSWVLGLPPEDGLNGGKANLARDLAPLMQRHWSSDAPVEACADLVCRAYEPVVRLIGRQGSGWYIRWLPPFGRRLRWDLVRSGLTPHASLARRIKLKLAERDIKVYRADLEKKLADQQGRLSPADIGALIVMPAQAASAPTGVRAQLSEADLAALFKTIGMEPPAVPDDGDPAFRYPEWDVQLQDYLQDHVRVQETVVAASGGSSFYSQTLRQHHGLVSRMRRAFQYLKPEGLMMLRQWPEGDDFDYRALIDFAVDLRAGRIPSDRLFIKRIKQERDVAVLLLVDLSRSTANAVIGGQGTVIDVAKQALVMFCEALQVVGDTYAIAGFSGTGRHAVDYFRIKNFDEPLSADIKQRISGLQPQRSTRMGAAIRHAAGQLAAVSARVRLLMLVSDGFPNDLGYKAQYAIADTRRAVQEARARHVHVKAITVNIGSDPLLDDLYGRVHHHVIGEVSELPDKLLRLYGMLTRVT